MIPVGNEEELRFFCDPWRHLVCLPYSVQNLHRMAEELGIKRCWYHSSSGFKHYDIPKRRLEEVMARCTVVTPRRILEIVKTGK